MRYWLRIAVVVGAVAALTTVLHVAWGGGALVSTLTHGVVYSACIGVLAGAILPPVCRRLAAFGRVVEWSGTLFVLLLVAVAGTFVSAVILGLLGYARGVPLMQRFAASFEMNALITAITGMAVTLYESQRSRLDALTLELRTQELERERDRKMALEARLSSLESRLHPHFLFNTLNAISELIHENPERAERTVERLAVLLRASLDATGRGTVPLAQELEIVGDYLEIEKTRLGRAADVSRSTWRPTPRAARCRRSRCRRSSRTASSTRSRRARAVVDSRRGAARVTAGSSSDVWDDGPGFDARARSGPVTGSRTCSRDWPRASAGRAGSMSPVETAARSSRCVAAHRRPA